MNKTIEVHDKSFELFISQEQIKERVQTLGAEISEQYADKNPLFVGILNGAFIFTADLVRACQIKSEITFLKTQSYTGMESSGKVTTFTFIPCSKIKSTPRIEARKPAASPSNKTVMFLVSRFINRI